MYVQGDQQFRAQPADLSQYYARAANRRDGAPRPSAGPPRRRAGGHQSFHLFRSTELTGSALPGVSSGQALQEMESIARETLPQGYDFAWAGMSLRRNKIGQPGVYLCSVDCARYLVLAAQYESWVLPFISLLGVPLAVFVRERNGFDGLLNDVFCQVGLVMLIGLAAKNSILIVEFAEQLRAQGARCRRRVEAARIRLRRFS